MPPKSIYRRPGAKHFQLVHRSQRDPLAHDPDASQHVLKEFERKNARGQTLAELEAELAAAGPSQVRDNLGEAVIYGVDFDDSEYDYMQHLREFGKHEEGVESILIEGPGPSAGKKKSAKDKTGPITLREDALEELIPKEALPSKNELARDYERDADAGEAIPSALRGLQPDMDQHLRQALEALDDDAFVDEELDGDDFFAELVADGERAADEEPEFPFVEQGLEDGEEYDEEQEDDDELDDSFEARFKRFKKQQNAQGSDDELDGSEVATERADTVSGLPKLPVVGGKRRRKGASEASGYSLSSSSMFRNQGLTDLDDRFDEIEKQYEDDSDSQDSDRSGSDDDEAPDLIAAREDFDALLDDFLDNYELVGNKMKPVMAGDTPLEKLDTLRRGFDAPRTNRVVRPVVELEDAIPELKEKEKEKDRWDCETILSTYSNLENHPRLIRARTEKPVPKIRLDPKTGLPSVAPTETKPKKPSTRLESEDDSDSYDDDLPRRETVTRPRNETAEEKKARKQAVKEERQARRAEKKATTEAFANESRKRVKTLNSQDPGKTRKL